MKAFAAGIISQMSGSPRLRKLLDGSLVKAADFYRRNRMPALEPEANALYQNVWENLAADLTVRSGPFKGMKYFRAEAAGSALTPKLLGSYERELHPVLERLITKGYDDVVDIGCAEGYYAVGMALRLPEARVHAFDTDATARELCMEMATLNGVSARISVSAFCSPDALIGLPKRGRTLVICDCESYEKALFTPSVRDALTNCDILIETHDFLDLTISTTLEALFDESHHLTLVSSVDDIQKAKHYPCPELQGLPVPVRFHLLREGRPMIMEWLLAEAR